MNAKTIIEEYDYDEAGREVFAVLETYVNDMVQNLNRAKLRYSFSCEKFVSSTYSFDIFKVNGNFRSAIGTIMADYYFPGDPYIDDATKEIVHGNGFWCRVNCLATSRMSYNLNKVFRGKDLNMVVINGVSALETEIFKQWS